MHDVLKKNPFILLKISFCHIFSTNKANTFHWCFFFFCLLNTVVKINRSSIKQYRMEWKFNWKDATRYFPKTTDFHNLVASKSLMHLLASKTGIMWERGYRRNPKGKITLARFGCVWTVFAARQLSIDIFRSY